MSPEKETKLLELAEGLPMARAGFDADDIRERAGRVGAPRRRGWTWAAAAAALFLLVATHAAAFLLGSARTQEQVASNAVEEAERLLRDMATLDAGTPHERLDRELVAFRGDLQDRDLAARLVSDEVPVAQRTRAQLLAKHVGQLMIAMEQYKDPGFRAIAVRQLATNALQPGEVQGVFLPETAASYQRVTPLGDGRVRVFLVRPQGGRPLVIQDEGTIVELATKYGDLEWTSKGEER